MFLNPDAISIREMYGEVNAISQEWTDGLASKIMINASIPYSSASNRALNADDNAAHVALSDACECEGLR